MKKQNIKWIVIAVLVLFLFLCFFTPLGTIIQKPLNQLAFTEAKVKNSVDFSDFKLNLKAYNSGKDFNLKEAEGKVIFINFWGSWCPPCREEMPSIQKLYNDYKDQVVFVPIAISDKPNDFTKFLKENRITFPVYVSNDLIEDNIKPVQFPTTYILAKNGEIALKYESMKDWNSQEVRDLMDKLIKESQD